MTQSNGGPAFPQPEQAHPNQPDPSAKHLQGMSLRDWFAGQALQWYLASSPSAGAHRLLKQERLQVARSCYEIADAMLAERNNGTS